MNLKFTLASVSIATLHHANQPLAHLVSFCLLRIKVSLGPQAGVGKLTVPVRKVY